MTDHSHPCATHVRSHQTQYDMTQYSTYKALKNKRTTTALKFCPRPFQPQPAFVPMSHSMSPFSTSLFQLTPPHYCNTSASYQLAYISLPARVAANVTIFVTSLSRLLCFVARLAHTTTHTHPVAPILLVSRLSPYRFPPLRCCPHTTPHLLFLTLPTG